MSARTFDPGPVLELAARLTVADDAVTGLPTVRGIADTIGTTARTVHRWKAGARLNAVVADRLAIALDSHPCILWPDFYADEAA